MKYLLNAVLVVTMATADVAQDERPSKLVLFTNVNVFNGIDDKLTKADVLVENNLIKQVSTEPLAIIATESSTIIDGGGRTLMPGLIDSHVHLFMSATADPTVREHQLVGTYAELRATIARHLDQHFENGVVAVRDGGDRYGHALRFKQAATDSDPLPVALTAV